MQQSMRDLYKKKKKKKKKVHGPRASTTIVSVNCVLGTHVSLVLDRSNA